MELIEKEKIPSYILSGKFKKNKSLFTPWPYQTLGQIQL